MSGRLLRAAFAIVCGGAALDVIAVRQFDPQVPQAATTVVRVDSYRLPDLLRRVRRDGAVLIDCRTPEQIALRSIPGAVPYEQSLDLHPRLKILFDAGNSTCPNSTCSHALALARTLNEAIPFSAAFYPGGWAEWTTAFPTPNDEPAYLRQRAQP